MFIHKNFFIEYTKILLHENDQLYNYVLGPKKPT